MHRNRARGFTLFELMIIVVITGLLATLALPKFVTIRDRQNIAGARARIESAIATARAAAIHKGRLSIFLVSGNTMAVWTQNPTTGFWQQQITSMNLAAVYPGVSVQFGGAGWNYVYYEPRGMTWSIAKPPSTLVFRIVGQTRRDSVCVSRQGQILPRGCTL